MSFRLVSMSVFPFSMLLISTKFPPSGLVEGRFAAANLTRPAPMSGGSLSRT